MIAQEQVNLPASILVRRMYRDERVPLHAVTLERGQAPHNPGAVLGEERGPRIVEEGAVGPDRVHDPQAWLLQRLGQLDW